jgi:hypothetical protein
MDTNNFVPYSENQMKPHTDCEMQSFEHKSKRYMYLPLIYKGLTSYSSI